MAVYFDWSWPQNFRSLVERLLINYKYQHVQLKEEKNYKELDEKRKEIKPKWRRRRQSGIIFEWLFDSLLALYVLLFDLLQLSGISLFIFSEED